MAIAGLALTLSSPAGSLSLNAGSYKLEASTRSERAVSRRKVEASNPFVEGTYLVHTVKENVTETVSVHVRAATASLTFDAMRTLTNALDQISYSLTFAYGGATETWSCFAAEYTVTTTQEYQHDGLILVKATIPRLPTVVKVP